MYECHHLLIGMQRHQAEAELWRADIWLQNNTHIVPLHTEWKPSQKPGPEPQCSLDPWPQVGCEDLQMPNEVVRQPRLGPR
jgi:hypothetical protein